MSLQQQLIYQVLQIQQLLDLLDQNSFAYERSDFLCIKNQILVNVYSESQDFLQEISIISNNYLNKLIHIIYRLQNFYGYHDHAIQQIVSEIYITLNEIQQRHHNKHNNTILCCEIPMVVDKINNLIFKCVKCGEQQEQNKHGKFILAKKVTKANYVAMKHFDRCFKNIFQEQQQHIEESVIAEIKQLMKRDRKTTLSIDDTRQYLKRIVSVYGPTYNKMDAQIMQTINNGPVCKLSGFEYNYIKEAYLLIITIFYQINYQRDSIPNCIYFIKKIINILYADIDKEKVKQCNQLIYIQKQTTINKINKLWNTICEHIDVQQLQQHFKTQYELHLYNSQKK